MTAFRLIRRLRDLLDVSGTAGTGKAPVSDGTGMFVLTDVATQPDLDAVEAGVVTSIATHNSDTTGVHGISDTALLLTTATTLDQIAAPVGPVGLNSQKITGLGTPVAATDAATKAYADVIATGLTIKASVQAATTANITLSGAQTIDGVSVVAGNRVLVKNQTTGADNGIYVAAAGAWARSTDADTSAEVTSGLYTFVEGGSTQGNGSWILTTANPITLGSTALTFTQFASTGGAAPTTVDYLVGTSNPTLTGEIVVGPTPGGELGGSWISPTVATVHSGSSHADIQAAAEATAAAALDGHVTDTTDAHAAAAITADSTSLVGIGTNVQDALEELDDAIAAVASSGSLGSAYSLASSTAALATTLTVERTPKMLVNGTYVAIGALTTKCEVRRVTGIATNTLTVGALAYAHTAGENVWVLNATLVPAEWFGCQATITTVDNHAGLQQAFHDMAFNGGYGITGHGARYYCATPVCIYDNTTIDRLAITAKASGFTINPLVGLGTDSNPDQFMEILAGQVGTITNVDTATNVITTSTVVGSQLGDRMTFYPRQGATLPAPLEAGRGYYCKTFPGTNQYTISIDYNGADLDLTDTGSGTTIWYSPGASRMRWREHTLEGSEITGLNGLLAFMQQPSEAYSLRVSNFPGPTGACKFGGQQAAFYNLMITDAAVGLRLQGAQMMYFSDSNFEDCDILVITDARAFDGGASGGGIRNNKFNGCHYEAPGIHTAIIQTIFGNASVSAGTFTLTFRAQTTSAIAYNASAATIQTALEALSTVDPGDVTVTQEVGLLSAGGRMRLTFAGQYAYSTVSRATLSSTGLTGGLYAVGYYNPNARCVSLRAGVMTRFYDSEVSAGNTLPDGSTINFVTVESTADVTTGFAIVGASSTTNAGLAVNDLLHGHTLAWADTTGTSENLDYYSVGGYHGGAVVKNHWWMGRAGQHMVWDGGSSPSLTLGAGAMLRQGTTGTGVKAMTTGATSVADGATVTHGLGVAPDVVQVTPSVAGEFVSVTAKDATTFTCAIKKHDGTAGTTQTLYWVARDI